MTFDVPVMQLTAYMSLTAASVIVATVSAIFGYRANYGWGPIALITSHGLSGIGGSSTHFNALLSIEFWNRRKYPVALTSISVTFKTLEFKYSPSPNDLGWFRVGGGYHKSLGVRLEPAAHQSFQFSAPFEAKSIDALRDTVEVIVSYFDPISGKHKAATTTHTYTFQSDGR